jgi:acid stress-induced BolA-like protein IbaG/YrbA
MDNLAPETIKTYIENALECDLVRVDDDGARIEALIVSPVFRGKSMVQQHQLVYGALGEYLREESPALSMKTFTPEDWADRGGT